MIEVKITVIPLNCSPFSLENTLSLFSVCTSPCLVVSTDIVKKENWIIPSLHSMLWQSKSYISTGRVTIPLLSFNPIHEVNLQNYVFSNWKEVGPPLNPAKSQSHPILVHYQKQKRPCSVPIKKKRLPRKWVALI